MGNKILAIKKFNLLEIVIKDSPCKISKRIMTKKLSPNGIIEPKNFPIDSYESIHKEISSKKASDSNYHHFSGSWNALTYRYQSMIDHGEAFKESLKQYGTAPEPSQRYQQEKNLFDFFNSCFSCFESLFYAFYVTGHFISPNDFELSTPRHLQNITPNKTKGLFETTFSSENIINDFDNIFNDPNYQKIREIRNILAHRTAPGRTVYVSIGSEEAPTTEWKLNNIPLTESLIDDSQKNVSDFLNILLNSFDTFIKSNLT